MSGAAVLAPLADARAAGFGLDVCAAPVDPTETGWRPAAATGQDDELLAELLDRVPAATGSRSAAVAATWHLEHHAWHVVATAMAAMLVHRAVFDLDTALLHDGDDGLPDAIAVAPAGWYAVPDAATLACALEAHFAPLVDRLAAYRPSRALWRCCGDRVGQAAQWCAEAFGDLDAAWSLAAGVLVAPTALGAPLGLTTIDGEVVRRRSGCCLSLRCPGGVPCADCPTVAGLRLS